MNTILLFLIGIPAIEIFVMIKIGQNVGAFNTVLLIFLTAVMKINKMVLNAPIFWPILIIKNISMAGMATINKKIVFICPFPNYINNVYLSNNE